MALDSSKLKFADGPDEIDLKQDLLANAEMVAAMECEQFCADLWTALVNSDWVRFNGPVTDEDLVELRLSPTPDALYLWSGSFRYVGGIIADVRNICFNTSEDYMRWYCSNTHPYSHLTDQVKQAMAAIGWYQVRT